MRNIGIMSMHRIFNYGSFLQGYGLKQLLKGEDSHANITFLDYHRGTPLLTSNEGDAKGLRRVFNKISEYSKVNASFPDKLRFFNHKRTYARRYFPLLGLSPQENYDYAVDLQVIGSDEVFNCVQSNANVGYSRDLFGHGSPARRLISYAGSFGNTTIEKLKRHSLLDNIAADFSRFSDISVRDENSRKIIREATGIEPTINVDPVLAYDYMAMCSEIPLRRLIKDKYLIVYGYSGRFTSDENQEIRRYARARKLTVVCVGGVQDCCDRFVDCSPFEVLSLFRDADGIITDTFHGSIFSIINKKNFMTVIRRSHGDGYGNEEKLGYLLGSLGLADSGTFDLTSASLEGALSQPVDYSETERRLAAARRSAQDYLARNVNAIKVEQ